MSKGFRSKTRRKLRKNPRVRTAITRYLKEFEKGTSVIITLEPASHKGMPFPRFKGRVGRVVEKRGGSYVIEIFDGNKLKKIISRPEHLRQI